MKAAAVAPVGDLVSEGGAETALLHHHFQHLLAEDSAEDVRVQPADGLKSAVLSAPTSLRHQPVQVGVKVELVAVGLNRQDGGGHCVRAQGVLQIQAQASPGTAAV